MTVRPSTEAALLNKEQYAENSLTWTHGQKSEDELLQRLWNLAGDVQVLAAALRAPADTLTEAPGVPCPWCATRAKCWEEGECAARKQDAIAAARPDAPAEAKP